MDYIEVRNDEKVYFPFLKNALQYGFIAGGLIALCLFVMQVLGVENAIGLKYASYTMLGIVLAIGLGEYNKYLKTGTTFRNGMAFAAQISLFTGATLVLIHLITFLVGSDLVFSKYGLEATSFPNWLLLSGGIFLEVMVAGLVFTFIVLQFLKSRVDYTEEE